MIQKKADIAIFDVEPWEQEYLKQKLLGHHLTFFQKPLDISAAKKVSNAQILCVFVNKKIDKKILDLFFNLKFIIAMSTGFDHIDLVECKKKGITVAYVPTYGENTVAEHTMALLLNISRRIYDAIERTRTGDFHYEGLRGFDLKGKTLGVVGTGRIGRHVIRMAHGFTMNIVAYDKFPNKKAARELTFSYLPTLNDVLRQADIITLHTPYLPETHHLINTKNIQLCKKGVVIINTARGKLIQTKALLYGLKKGIIKAAGLDVLEEEAFLKEEKQLLSKTFAQEYDLKTVLEEHALMKYPNVYITPHNAFNSPEALQRILDTTVDNIKGFLKRKPVNVVK